MTGQHGIGSYLFASVSGGSDLCLMPRSTATTGGMPWNSNHALSISPRAHLLQHKEEKISPAVPMFPANPRPKSVTMFPH